jgi:hypothetical protein
MTEFPSGPQAVSRAAKAAPEPDERCDRNAVQFLAHVAAMTFIGARSTPVLKTNKNLGSFCGLARYNCNEVNFLSLVASRLSLIAFPTPRTHQTVEVGHDIFSSS